MPQAYIGQTLQDRIAQDIQTNINHAAVHTPWSVSPFTNQVHEALFRQSLVKIQAAGAVPTQFGVLSSEWDDEGYPSHETLSMGRRGRKKITIELSEVIWLPRAIAWVRGLHAMQTFLYQFELSAQSVYFTMYAFTHLPNEQVKIKPRVM